MSWLFIMTAAAGGVGAAARFILDGWITRTASVTIPVGTVFINVTGSFALGVLTMSVAGGLLAAPAQAVVGSGLLAGYTTFSTASTQTSDLIDHHRPRAAALYSGTMFAGSLGAAAAGMWCGSLLG